MVPHEKDTVAMPAADIPREAMPSPLPQRKNTPASFAAPDAATVEQGPFTTDDIYNLLIDQAKKRAHVDNAIMAKLENHEIRIINVEHRRDEATFPVAPLWALVSTMRWGAVSVAVLMVGCTVALLLFR